MIVSVSRRTDIPAFYLDWFLNRLETGYVSTLNPFNRKQVTKLSLLKEDVDCFVFWTKDGRNLLKNIDKLSEYNYYINYTITPYSKDLEPGLPNKQILVDNFIALSKSLGKSRVKWRYDPVLINEIYTIDYHRKTFELLCKTLSNHTEEVVISFVDLYKKTKRNTEGHNLVELSKSDMLKIADAFSTIAKRYNLTLKTCSESIDLTHYAIEKNQCVDTKFINETFNLNLVHEKDPSQRSACLCAKSVDIGAYNTCRHGCKYCYATFNHKRVNTQINKHDPDSELLIGHLQGDETIKVKKESPSLFKL